MLSRDPQIQAAWASLKSPSPPAPSKNAPTPDPTPICSLSAMGLVGARGVHGFRDEFQSPPKSQYITSL